MKKILLIGATKLSYMPYAKFYLNQLSQLDVEVHLLLWQRDNIPDEVLPINIITHRFIFPMEEQIPLYKKAKGYRKYRQYLIELFDRIYFDNLVVLYANAGILISSLLKVKYKGRYILDYRDYSKGHSGVLRKRLWMLSRNSAVTFISSEGFRALLPLDVIIAVAHNIIHSDWENRLMPSNKKQNKPIRVSFWGFVRHEEYNRKLLQHFANDERFVLHFYGKENSCTVGLINYCKANNVENVLFHGAYLPQDRFEFAENTEIIHNIYGDDYNSNLLTSNKYYDGVLFYLPQLCSKGSHMGEMVHEKSIGLACDITSPCLADEIYQYYTNINWSQFYKNCNIEATRILNEYQSSLLVMQQALQNS